MSIELAKFVEKNFYGDYQCVLESPKSTYHPELLNYEKAIIYAYSERGGDILKEETIKYLDIALSKISYFNGICYRGLNYNKSIIKKYFEAYKNGTKVCEANFISSSKSRICALQFSNEVLFTIYSKRGRDIEKIAKFGSDHPQNEKEVLFRKNTCFLVESFEKNNNNTYHIILNEHQI